MNHISNVTNWKLGNITAIIADLLNSLIGAIYFSLSIVLYNYNITDNI